MVMIDKGIPEICLFWSDGIKTFLSKFCPNTEWISWFRWFKIQNHEIRSAYLDIIWTEMLLCYPDEISISLERLYQSPQFFHHCKGKSMTYLKNKFFFKIFLVLKIIAPPIFFFFFFFFLQYTCFTFFLWRSLLGTLFFIFVIFWYFS